LPAILRPRQAIARQMAIGSEELFRRTREFYRLWAAGRYVDAYAVIEAREDSQYVLALLEPPRLV